jgi:hypothetical protein
MEESKMSQSNKESVYVHPDMMQFKEFKETITVEFIPQEDITAYEVAILLSYFFRPLHEEDWEKLGKAQRHLRRK